MQQIESVMQQIEIIPDTTLCGFYKLKKLLGVGDDKLEMILAVSGLKSMDFSNEKTGNVEKQYPLFLVKDALKELCGKDVAEEFRRHKEAEGMPEEFKKKYEEVSLRLLGIEKRRKKQWKHFINKPTCANE